VITRRALAVATLATGLALLPVQASAAKDAGQARVTLPAATLRAGVTVEVRWGGLPPGVEELEILLSLDGGRCFSVRVTPECDPHAGRYLWRVPNLATSDARLRLRLGIGGREIEVEPSARFAIVGRSDLSPEFDQFHENGWWAGLARGTSGPACGLTAPAASLAAARPVGALAPSPRQDSARASRVAHRDHRVAHGTPFQQPAPRIDSIPRFVPLRA